MAAFFIQLGSPTGHSRTLPKDPDEVGWVSAAIYSETATLQAQNGRMKTLITTSRSSAMTQWCWCDKDHKTSQDSEEERRKLPMSLLTELNTVEENDE